MKGGFREYYSRKWLKGWFREYYSRKWLKVGFRGFRQYYSRNSPKEGVDKVYGTCKVKMF